MAAQLPSPPFIDIPGLPNFRDLGGYPIASQPGKVVRHGVVFRSAEPSQTTDEGIDRLRQLRIAQVYDLRSTEELERDKGNGIDRGVKEWEGARRIHAPVLDKDDYKPEEIAKRLAGYSEGAEGFSRVYRTMLYQATKINARPYHQILQHLASDVSPPLPILIHCTAGKDRTGVICALILSLCGVEDEVIAHEYSLTNLGFKPRRAATIREIVAHSETFRDNPAGARQMVLARKEYMLKTLIHIRKEYGGSIEACVLKLRLLTREGIQSLRRNLIVDSSSTEAIDWREHAELVWEEEENPSPEELNPFHTG